MLMKQIKFLFSIVIVLVQIKSALPRGCSSRWTTYDGLCYATMPNNSTLVPWGLAQEGCMKLDPRGHLPIFRDNKTWLGAQKAISAFMTKLSQIVVQNSTPEIPEMIPLGAYKLNDKWLWIDDSDVNFNLTKWQKGQPDGKNSGMHENCLGYDPTKNLGLSDMPCDLNVKYICQMDPNEDIPVDKNYQSIEMNMSNATEVPPQHWTDVNGVYYTMSSTDLHEKNEAADLCHKMDSRSYLPRFHNTYDYVEFVRYVSAITEADHREILLDLEKVNGSFMFSNGHDVDYTNWAPNQPYEVSQTDNCVYSIDLNGYRWEAFECTTTGLVFCQIDTRSIVSVRSQPTTTTTTTTMKEKTTPPAEIIKGQKDATKGTGNKNNGSRVTLFLSSKFILLITLYATVVRRDDCN